MSMGFCILLYLAAKRRYDLLWACVCASCAILEQTGVGFVTGMGFCLLWYLTADRGYDLLRAWVSASCGILQQTGGTIHCGHQVLLPLILHSRQEVRFVMGMGFCILWYLTADGRYDLLRA